MSRLRITARIMLVIRGQMPVETSIRENFNYAEIAQAFFNALQQCRIVLLDNGNLAIGPGDVYEGDAVYALQGAASPCLLRSDELKNRWILISGDVYIASDAFVGFWDNRYDDCDNYIAQNPDQLENFRIR
ncbi:hypothetical protein EK21DRAFT_116126 [Setomelanomma holmii]|uniref:Uncharacterized protein n=1 Tax=Setomelanomma holmii TaxID=210430 RepID=A0A9P4H333_9PLEO|nr:hypothetical protein EK21DRAFT_116126 [Setomelanomma holmii]